jgi:hypothetical protein
MGLMGKSKAFAMNVVGNEIWQRVGEYFLTSRLQHNWVTIADNATCQKLTGGRSVRTRRRA